MTQAAPLARGEDGVWRVTGSRVTLDSIVHQFKNGATAEQIQEDFPSVTLRDIYSVIAHYLQQTGAVEDYLREQTRATDEARREVEGGMDTRGWRERLRQRRARAAV
ncbi:MAG: DUF433 domain-containing protein [Limisphaerales bacterium]